MTGILCPTCEGPSHRAVTTDAVGDFRRRQVVCKDCNTGFSTYEARAEPGGRFMEAVHLHRALIAMGRNRRRLVEGLIEELAPQATVDTGGPEA